jgi:hypothetical protein
MAVFIPRGTSLRSILYDIGLRSGLVLCLDARDIRSYPGTGTQLKDLSGNGHDFDFTGGLTFSGTANSRSAYLASDGTGYLTYETTNASWMTAMHQAGAKFSWLFVFYHTTGLHALMGDTAATSGSGLTAGTGVNCTVTSIETINVRARNASATVMTSYSSTATVTENAYNFVGFSVDAAAGASGGKAQINDTAETFDATYTSPSAGSATATLQIGAIGNGNSILTNGDRLAYVAAWHNRALTAAELARARVALKRLT